MVSDPVAKYRKNRLNADIFLQVLEKQGKNLFLSNVWNPW